MTEYVLKRLAALLLTAIGATVLTFLIIHLTPGDPVLLVVRPGAAPETYAEVRHQLGLDQPLATQYFSFLGRILTGDFGRSIYTHEEVLPMLLQRLPNTLELTAAALLISLAVGIPTGVLAAAKRDSWVDQAIRSSTLFMYGMPAFWLGLLLILVFAIRLHWFPIAGTGGLSYIVLPALTLAWEDAALMSRMTRSGMLEVLGQEYIMALRAKGLPERLVVYKHALRNALVSVITILGMRIGWLIAGSVVVETVFSRPGVGRLLVYAISQRDYPVVQGALLILAITVILGNALADMLYGVVDPRIRRR
jgi:ABC-type dipeptide/oligopeptide/nickel transport system permease component